MISWFRSLEDQSQTTPEIRLALFAMGAAAWLVAALLAFFNHSELIATAFVGCGLVLMLVAGIINTVSEMTVSAPGGSSVNFKRITPGSETEALDATPEEQEIEPPLGTVPAPDPEAEIRDGARVYKCLNEVPTRTLSALFSNAKELSEVRDAQFVEALRKVGQGNHPWVFKYRLEADDQDLAWRVSWGGRGKSSATVEEH